MLELGGCLVRRSRCGSPEHPPHPMPMPISCLASLSRQPGRASSHFVVFLALVVLFHELAVSGWALPAAQAPKEADAHAAGTWLDTDATEGLHAAVTNKSV